VRGLVGSIQKGQFSVAVEPKGLEPYLHRVEKTANRLVLAMLMSSLLLAAAFIVSAYHPVLPGGVIGPILAGLLGAVAVAGVALVWISRRKSLLDKQSETR
jgi:uncharacterized protein (DUF2062 family)